MQTPVTGLNTPSVILSPTGHTSEISFIIILTTLAVCDMNLIDICMTIQLKDKLIGPTISHDLCGYFVHIFISVNTNKNKLVSHAMSSNLHTNFGFRHFPQREDLLVYHCVSWRSELAFGLGTQTNEFTICLHCLDHPWLSSCHGHCFDRGVSNLTASYEHGNILHSRTVY